MFGIEKTYKLLKWVVINKNEFTFYNKYFKKGVIETEIIKAEFEKVRRGLLKFKTLYK